MRDPLDVARYIFVNDENELRSGWRVLAFVACVIISAALLTGLKEVFATLIPSFAYLRDSERARSASQQLVYLVVSNVINLAAAMIASGFCARLLERRSLASVGFKLHPRWRRDFALGSLLGGSSLAIAVGIIATVGAVSFVVQTRKPGDLAQGLAITALFFVVAGATEELVFRGFPFQAFVHGLGGARAIAITAFLFGIAHITNPGATPFSTINTILAGVWLGIAYLMTRSLWLATALHWSWNFAMVFVFGLPVSGFTSLDSLSWLRSTPGPPVWISGGGYGPEGGAAATLALILSTLTLWKSGLFIPSAEMVAAIKHGKREEAVVSVVPQQTLESKNPSDDTQSVPDEAKNISDRAQSFPDEAQTRD